MGSFMNLCLAARHRSRAVLAFSSVDAFQRCLCVAVWICLYQPICCNQCNLLLLLLLCLFDGTGSSAFVPTAEVLMRCERGNTASWPVASLAAKLACVLKVLGPTSAIRSFIEQRVTLGIRCGDVLLM